MRCIMHACTFHRGKVDIAITISPYPYPYPCPCPGIHTYIHTYIHTVILQYIRAMFAFASHSFQFQLAEPSDEVDRVE